MSQQMPQLSMTVTAAPSTVVGSSFGYPGGFSAARSIQSVPAPPAQTEERTDTLRMWRIAKDMLDCKKYDYSIIIPRHISQDYDELWVAPHSTAPCNLQGIPRQLLMVPKDANFLVDVFFENSCFYYPIVNRAVVETHLMDPHTPQALFILNVIFMAACKHLGRNTDIKRAIQFRERAREIQQYIDGKARLSRMQAHLLGSQVIYGVFSVVIGMAQICGTYQPLATTDSLYDENNSMIDLAAESRSIVANKGVIPETAYQQRLWAFWGYYTRDAISRLYFGWPHGFDNAIVTAELPKIKGCVGFGGMRKNLTGQSGSDGPVTGKRRGPKMKKKQIQREKKVLRAELQGSRNAYRMTSSISDDDDDDDDEDELREQDDESDLEQEEFAAVNDPSMYEKDVAENDKRHKWPTGAGGTRNNAEPNMSAPSIDGKASSSQQSKDKVPSFSGLSRNLLERQSRGEDIGRRQGGHGTGSGSNSIEVRRHLDRMKVLLDAESDVTDGGAYTRILFLEEIKLWSIGRRVGLYLQGRSTSMTVNPAAAATGSYSPNSKQGSETDSRDHFGPTISATLEASRCSESVWLEDKELQGLQAELIAWEQALPPMFKFRQDVESPDINHKVNGKLGILTMYYYTITIMLQSSYLPIPQYLKSSPRSSALKSPESLSQEYDGMFSRSASRSMSEESNGGGPRIKSEVDDYLLTGRSPQPCNGYFNTAHQICTQLSNVLFHHVELMLDSYPNWCAIQCKLNQTLAAALRVSCLNARLGSNSKAIRNEAKAGFKMGSDLFKRQALLPDPLTVRDWPAEEDVKVMLDLEEEFRELMTTQDEELAMAEARSRSQTRGSSEGLGYEDPGDHLLYVPEYQDGATTVPLNDNGLPLDGTSQQYDVFRAEHVFGLSDEGFQFDYNIDA
ncbi:hypothetical protein BGZ58_008392 [Dissophora ornata]|nr:hypothetical protein BGZ58_008392 [Dissophora ornata]